MDNPFDQFDEPKAGGAAVVAPPAAPANEFDQFDAPAAKPAAGKPANEFDQFDPPSAAAPTSSAAGDFFSNLGQSMVRGTGQMIKGTARLVGEGAKSLGLPLGTAFRDSLQRQREMAMLPPLTEEELQAAEKARGPDGFEKLASEYKPDPERAGSAEAAVARVMGTAAPTLALAPVAPAAVVGLAGQMGEAQRERALQQGDSPELADAKFKIGAVGGAVFGAVGGSKLLPTRAGAGLVEKLLVRGVEGAGANAGVEAAQEKALGENLDWGALKQQGAFGAGLGLALHVPEALALLKKFGPAARNVEGKTLQEAVNQIAEKTGQHPTEIQRQINEAVGVKAAPTPEEHAVRGAEVESALGARAQAEASGAHQAAGEAQQAQTMFEARLNRRAEAEAAFAAQPPETTVPAEAPSPAPAPDALAASGSAPTKNAGGGQAESKMARPAKGATFKVGNAPDGSPDLLTAIENLGGAPGPKKGLAGPEYDGFHEAFGQGPARLLRRGGKGGIDTFIHQLEGQGFKFDSLPEFYDAVAKASEQRVKLAKQLGDVEYGAKFDAALFSDAGRKAHLAAGEPVPADTLNAGDKFKIRGEPVRVTEVTDEGVVKVSNGVKREIPPGTPIYPDRGEVARRPVSTDFLEPEPQPLPEGAKVEYLGKNFPVMAGVGEPVHHWQVSLPGEGRGRTLTADELRAEGYQVPEVPEAKPELAALPRGARGAIDPKLLFPVARAAMGGAIGYATGKTPEERVRNALVGMGFGLTPELLALTRKLVGVVQTQPLTKDAAAAAEKQLTRLRTTLAPQSFLPAEIRTQLKWGDQAKEAITKQGMSLTADLTKDIRGMGDKSVQGAAAKAVHEYLTGARPIEAVPGPARVAAEKVRNFVDALSDRAVAEGVVQGTMAETFLSGRGSYLRRSYDIFLDKDYQPKPAQIEAAVQAVARENQLTPGEARLYVNDLLARHNREALPGFLVGQGKIAGKEAGSLIARKDLLPEIRDLFGEVKDPVLATNQTVPRLARLIEMEATQKNIREIGLRTGLFRDEARMQAMGADEVGQWVPLVSDANKPHDNFRGLWTTPEIAQAFQKTAGSGQLAGLPGLLWRGWTTAVSTAKAAKTIFNPESYAANFVGHAMMNLANGNFRYNHAGRALALGAEELGALRKFLGTASPAREALREELQRLNQLGVFHESVVGEDLLKTIDQSFWTKVKNPAVKVISTPGKLYNEMFNFNRYVGWQSERARYAAAFPDMPAAELDRKAADIVSATTPTYSEVPKFLKQMSVAGLTPSFLNFPFEVFRNTFNAAKIGRADLLEGLRTGNVGLIKAGATRLGALTAVLAASSGWGVARLSRQEHGVSEEQDEATRFFGPAWNKEGALQYHGAIANGQAQYSNLEYLLPHSIVTQALDAAVRGADEGQAAQSFLNALTERFTGNNILAGPLAGAITGHDPETGRAIPKTAVSPTLGDRARYLWEKAFQPLVIPWAGKFAKALKGEQGDYGQVYTVEDQMLRLAAVRSQTLDFNKAVAFKARDMGEQFNQATGLYRSRMKENLAPNDLAQAYQNAEVARQTVFSNLVKMRQLGNAVGVNDDTIIKAMKSAQIPSRVILGVLDGQYVPGDRGAKLTAGEVLSAILQRPAEQRQAALASVYQKDPTLAKGVIERLRQNAQGLNPRDRIIMGLGISDGERANYIRERLSQLPDATARRSWLQDLQGKRILTNAVWAQMVKSGQN